MSKTDHQSTRGPRVYLAGPLFSEAERTFNVRVTELLEEFTEVYLPERDGELMTDLIDTGVPSDVAASRVFRRDMDAIRQADYLIAILDGRAIDEGVAFELGVALSHSKRCIGLQTDCRRLAAWGNNPMITGALEVRFTSLAALMEWFKAEALVERTTSPAVQHLTTASR